MTRSVIFIITAIFALGICSVHAQQQPCTPPPATGEAKLTPVWYDLSCIETRHSYSATIYLETLTSVGGMKIDSMRLCAIDTIPGDESLANEADFNGLPDGISYVTSNGTPTKTWKAGETGCIKLSDTTSAPVGNYQIAFYFSIWTKDQGQITDCQADTSYGLSTQDIPHYILRVREPESPCDTIIETFPPDTTGIHDKGKPELRSRITSLHPTPFTQSAQVHVHIEDPARYELTIWNMLGEEVRQRAITLERGQNRFHIKRGELTNGVYLLTIANRNGNGNKRLSQQFVINSD